MAEHGGFDELTRRFRALGAPDPEGWARSQLEEGLPQLARFLFLREAWRRVVAESSHTWIEAAIAAADRASDAPYAGAGRALRRLRALGASDADLTELVRGKQAELLFALCDLLDDPTVDDPAAEGVAWALVQIDDHGEILGGIPALHESVLETDPTGREMRPRPDA
jgi:hypothetical protein